MKRGYCSSDSLDLTSVPPRQNEIVSNHILQLDPTDPLPKVVDFLALNFHAEANAVEFSDLQNSFLEIVYELVKIVDDKEKKIDLIEDVSVVPCLGLTGIRLTEVLVGERPVDPAPTAYDDVAAYIKTILFFNRARFRSRLQGSLGYFNEPGMGFHTTFISKEKDKDGKEVFVENSGEQTRIARLFKQRKSGVRVLTPLNHFLSEQERFLPAGISLHFRFHFNSSKRLIICPTPTAGGKEIQY